MSVMKVNEDFSQTDPSFVYGFVGSYCGIKRFWQIDVKKKAKKRILYFVVDDDDGLMSLFAIDRDAQSKLLLELEIKLRQLPF
jgi:hypothetical protein